MTKKRESIIEECIRSIQMGTSINDCIKRYPGMEDELRDVLQVIEALSVHNFDNPTRDQMSRSRDMLLVKARKLADGTAQEKDFSGSGWLRRLSDQLVQFYNSRSPLAGRLITALGIAMIFILLSGSLLVASAKSLPGDSLYAVKRAVENLQVDFTHNDDLRREIEDRFSQLRVDEVEKLLSLKRNQQISFEGTIESIAGNQWMVSGVPVVIQPGTSIIYGPEGIEVNQPGTRIEVEGETDNNDQVIADEIHVHEYRFAGVMEQIQPGFWQISGVKVSMRPNTLIDPGISLGDRVIVLIDSEDSGLFALAVVLDEEGTLEQGSAPASSNNPTLSTMPTTDDGEDQQLIGTLESINENHWMVSGQDFYIVNGTVIPEKVNIGDSLRVVFKIEANGSFTAVEIEDLSKSNTLDDNGEHGTPEPTIDNDKTEITVESTPESTLEVKVDEQEPDTSHEVETTQEPEATESVHD